MVFSLNPVKPSPRKNRGLFRLSALIAISLTFTIIKYAVILSQALSWAEVRQSLWIVVKVSALLALGLGLLAYLGSRRIAKQIV